MINDPWIIDAFVAGLACPVTLFCVWLLVRALRRGIGVSGGMNDGGLG